MPEISIIKSIIKCIWIAVPGDPIGGVAARIQSCVVGHPRDVAGQAKSWMHYLIEEVDNCCNYSFVQR